MMKKTFIVYAVVTAGIFVLGVIIAQGDLLSLVDAPSLALVLGPAILMLLSHFGPKEFINAFKTAMAKSNAGERELKNALLFFSTAQTLIIASTIAAIFLGIVMVLTAVWKGYAHSAKTLGGWMAVDLISILYAAMLMIVITIPFKSAVRKKMNDLND
jgi:hypothetical protein